MWRLVFDKRKNNLSSYKNTAWTFSRHLLLRTRLIIWPFSSVIILKSATEIRSNRSRFPFNLVGLSKRITYEKDTSRRKKLRKPAFMAINKRLSWCVLIPYRIRCKRKRKLKIHPNRKNIWMKQFAT